MDPIFSPFKKIQNNLKPNNWDNSRLSTLGSGVILLESFSSDELEQLSKHQQQVEALELHTGRGIRDLHLLQNLGKLRYLHIANLPDLVDASVVTSCHLMESLAFLDCPALQGEVRLATGIPLVDLYIQNCAIEAIRGDTSSPSPATVQLRQCWRLVAAPILEGMKVETLTIEDCPNLDLNFVKRLKDLNCVHLYGINRLAAKALQDLVDVPVITEKGRIQK